MTWRVTLRFLSDFKLYSLMETSLALLSSSQGLNAISCALVLDAQKILVFLTKFVVTQIHKLTYAISPLAKTKVA